MSADVQIQKVMEIIWRLSPVAGAVILAGLLLLARLRPRPAHMMRTLCLSALVCSLLADIIFIILTWRLYPCSPMDDMCGLQFIIMAYLLQYLAAGFCLIASIRSVIPLRRGRHWLVSALGVLPLVDVVMIQVVPGYGASLTVSFIENTWPFHVSLALTPMLIYGLFFAPGMPRDSATAR